jgi:hypothetical protein
VKTAGRAAVLVFLLPVVAGATEDGVPLPHGWIGTTSEWMRGLGIAFIGYTLFMFFGQPLFVLAFVLLVAAVLVDLKARRPL